MSYQECPKCKGTGKRYEPIPLSFPYAAALNVTMEMPMPYKKEDGSIGFIERDNTCPVCKGKMIINSDTGLPPMDTLNTDKK